jgi:hypothetical protein
MSETVDAMERALEAYRRARPHKANELDEAYERFDPDSEEEVAPAASGPEPAASSEQLPLVPPPDQPPTAEELPEVPHGRGLTAMEAAERLAEDWRRRETLRRRCQELCNPYQMLTVIGRRPGANTHADQHVYAISELGRDALAARDAGEYWTVTHLVRREDPETAQEAARKIRPGVDFHTVLALFARDDD